MYGRAWHDSGYGDCMRWSQHRVAPRHRHPCTGEDSELLTHSPPQILLKGRHVLSVNDFCQLLLRGSNSFPDQSSLEFKNKNKMLLQKRGQFQLGNWQKQHPAGCQSKSIYSAHVHPGEIGFPLVWAGTAPSCCMGTGAGSQAIMRTHWLWASRARSQSQECGGNSTAGVSARIQELMDRVSSTKLESPRGAVAQPPPLPEVIFITKGSGHKLHKKQRGRRGRRAIGDFLVVDFMIKLYLPFA